MTEGQHLNPEGLDLMWAIKNEMNTGRKIN
jgi:hypothetical protein